MKIRKTWFKTKVQGLVRHKSGVYYARLFVGGKEKWVSLKTRLIEVAKAKLKEEKSDIEEARRVGDIKSGKMLVGEAKTLFLQELDLDIEKKTITRQRIKDTISSLERSWPTLWELDVRKVTVNDCKAWAARMTSEWSPSYFNHTATSLKGIFDVAIRNGLIYRNPAKSIPHIKPRPKNLILPTRSKFLKYINAIRSSEHRTAQDSADLVEFLAYTGCRVSEAKRIKWRDCNFKKEEILVLGDPETGTKNGEIRRIPMIPHCKELLERIKREREEILPDMEIMLVGDARGAMQRAEKIVKIAHISHHDLRHLFATVCIESGVDIPTVSRWLGHKDGGALAMRTYGHLRNDHSRQAAQKVSF